MKKRLAVLAACGVLLCSCAKGGETAPEPVPDSFSVTAEITDGDFSCIAEMTRSSKGWEIVMSEPDTVDGVTFLITGEDMSVRMGELVYSAAHEDIPDGSPVRLTAAALDRCVKNRTEGELYGQHYAVELEKGEPVQLVVGTQFSVKFSGFKENKS